jgi:hypothetical protein
MLGTEASVYTCTESTVNLLFPKAVLTVLSGNSNKVWQFTLKILETEFAWNSLDFCMFRGTCRIVY